MNPCTNNSIISAYHDGELDAIRRSAFESHLAGCAACKAELARLRGMTAALRAARRPVLPDHVLTAFHRRLDWATPALSLDRWARRMALAACVLLMAAVSFYLVEPRTASSSAGESAIASASWERAAVTPDNSASSANTTLALEADTAQWIVNSLDGSSHD